MTPPSTIPALPQTSCNNSKLSFNAPEIELQRIQAEKARRSLHEFVRLAWPILEPATPFVDGIHVEAICLHLQAISENRLRHLIINVPPGHAKSLLAAVFWPAWDWITHPARRWLFASYSADLSVRDSVRCRKLISSDWYQQLWGDVYQLSADQNEKHRFANDGSGYRIATSVNGTATGERADIVVVDDPHSVDQAESETQRRAAVEWFNGTMPTRLNDFATGHQVIIQQRLHEADLSGDLLGKGGFELLCLPAEFEPERRCRTSIGWSDPRTEPGELLWPAKITAIHLEHIKNLLGSYRYAGQYQQRPAPDVGGIFQRPWFRYWRPADMDMSPVSAKLADGTIVSMPAVPLPEEFDSVIQSWDLAFKDNTGSDYVVGQVWGVKGADRYLLDQRRERLNLPQTKEAMRALTAKWPQSGAKLVEDKANGPAVIQELQHEIQGLIPVNPAGGKVARAHAVAPMVESGNVYLPHPALYRWVEGFLDEVTVFPNARHDDQVDAMTQALNRLRGLWASFDVPESHLVVSPFGIPRTWPRGFVVVVTEEKVTALWGGYDKANDTVYLYDEHVLADADPSRNAGAIKPRGAWIPGKVHLPGFKGSELDKHSVTRLYQKEGLKVCTAQLGEESGVYHFKQMLKAQKLKAFSTLTHFLAEYRTGEKSALLLQCCFAMLAAGQQWMRPEVVPQLPSCEPAYSCGERGWMS